MKKNFRLSTSLRAAAVVALLTTIATWVSTGAHTGWTTTSTVTMEHDEITGIEYPVRRAAFVAGVEVLFAGATTAVALGGLSVLTRRRPRSHA